MHFYLVCDEYTVFAYEDSSVIAVMNGRRCESLELNDVDERGGPSSALIVYT